MVGLAFRFDFGRFHANPWGSHVNDAATEWPPSPWRILRALYSVARTNVLLSARQSEIDAALSVLANAQPPTYELPQASSGHTRHYMPSAKYSERNPGEKDRVIDGFMAVDRSAELRVWWDATLNADMADGLGSAAKCLGYLGRSESVCTARLITGAGPEVASAAAIDDPHANHPDCDTVDLLCPGPGDSLESLAVSIADLRRDRRLLPPGARLVPYAVARSETSRSKRLSKQTATPTIALFRLAGPDRPAMVDAVAVGQALRNALQHLYGRSTDGSASPTFSGRAGSRPRADQHRHAHYLALPDGAGPKVDRLIVWSPEGFGALEVAALASLTYLKMHGIAKSLPTALAALGTQDELNMPALLGPARSWRSLTPFGLVRHPKRRGDRIVDSPADQVRRELALRALPEPDEVELVRGPWHRFRSSKVGSSRLDRASLVGLRMRFAEPVRGPLALGAFSHFGLGLAIADD